METTVDELLQIIGELYIKLRKTEQLLIEARAEIKRLQVAQ